MRFVAHWAKGVTHKISGQSATVLDGEGIFDDSYKIFLKNALKTRHKRAFLDVKLDPFFVAVFDSFFSAFFKKF